MIKNIIAILLIIFIVRGCTRTLTESEMKEIIAMGDVVVEAIYEYHEEHNEYPDSLKQLIPDYLDSMPGFDNSLGEFRYLKIQKKFAEDERYGFELKVYDYKKFVIIGAKCMNYLIYQPSEKYPNRTFQKTHKLIGRWAYQTSCRTYGKLNRLIEK